MARNSNGQGVGTLAAKVTTSGLSIAPLPIARGRRIGPRRLARLLGWQGRPNNRELALEAAREHPRAIHEALLELVRLRAGSDTDREGALQEIVQLLDELEGLP